jgi:type VI secretion system protein ImpG
MRAELLTYYERELSFLRQMGADFAQQYPKVAGRLALEPDQCEDPHVERMLEGFALLAGRIHLKLDDDFPEVTQALLNIVYPHYLRPVPSMSVAEFEIDPAQIKPEAGLTIPRGASLITRPVEGLPCRFRTCYDLTFWPVDVAEAQWREGERLGNSGRAADVAGAFRIDLRTHGELPFAQLPLDSLRFYINGPSDLAHTIYELVNHNCVQVVIREGAGKTVAALPPASIRPVGFEAHEAALPYSNRSFAGYQIVQEYFAFPQKFLFFEISGLNPALARVSSDRVEIHIVISPFDRAERRNTLETGVSARTFRLGCVPIVNLFPQTAEPILLDHTRPEYRVVPDATHRAAIEVFSVEEVLATDPRTRAIERFEPFYAFRHAATNPPRRYWQAVRRPCARPEAPDTEVWLSFVNVFATCAVTVRALCTNGDLPSKLPIGGTASEFELEGAVPVKRISALVRPTATLRPPLAGDALWRLISQLSLNYLSVVEDGGEALREMLRLYNFNRSPHAERQIDGIVSVRSRRRFAPLPEADGVSFARGTQVEIEFDEQQFVGGGVCLFAAVLERFLGQYCSINSFCQLLARSRQRKEVLKSWPPRAGRRVLL